MNSFLSWSDDSEELLFRKNDEYYIYNIKEDELRLIFEDCYGELGQFVMWRKS